MSTSPTKYDIAIKFMEVYPELFVAEKVFCRYTVCGECKIKPECDEVDSREILRLSGSDVKRIVDEYPEYSI